MRLRYVLVLNFVLAILWSAFQQSWDPANFMIGFIVGFILLSFVRRGYGSRMVALISFVTFLLFAIVSSSIQVARYVLSPKLQLNQGIVAIPLEAETYLEVAALATAITLTPGTLSVDVGTNEEGQGVLFVHNLVMNDPDKVRHTIKQDFERRILRATRGGILPW
ncbi:MAG: Na+/H+ antiporter subunit E [Caldilineaceae bacterium]|nr:Na+/H+ antiporter subunit E [Caldilineaceae bacterium]